jgi:hypothetical protein
VGHPLTHHTVHVRVPEGAGSASGGVASGGAGVVPAGENWDVRVVVVDATLADRSSPVVASVDGRVMSLEDTDWAIDVPEQPPGARWELQVHARAAAANAPPAEDPQVRVGDLVTMVALPVPPADGHLEAEARTVHS